MRDGRSLELLKFELFLQEQKKENFRKERAHTVMSVLQELDTARFINLLNFFTIEKGVELHETDFPTIKKWLISL